jgi:hypothetical protein
LGRDFDRAALEIEENPRPAAVPARNARRGSEYGSSGFDMWLERPEYKVDPAVC